jgi:hypothetical protein
MYIYIRRSRRCIVLAIVSRDGVTVIILPVRG